MKKKLFNVLIFYFILNFFNLVNAEHEKYYLQELPGNENLIYNELIKKYNKWNDESEGDYSCSKLAVTITYLVDIADCQYRKTSKYMKRNGLNVSQEFLDVEYDYYKDMRAKALLVAKRMNNYGIKNSKIDIQNWEDNYFEEFIKKKFYQRDIWKEYAIKEQKYITKITEDKLNEIVKKKEAENNYKDYWWIVVLLALGTFLLYTMTVKKPKINLIKKKKSKLKGRIAKYWAGEESLAFSFWGVSTIGVIIFQIPNYILISMGDAYIDNLSDISLLIYALYIISLIIYLVIAYVGCWRSAARYIKENLKKKKSAFWGYTSYFLIVLSVIRMFGQFLSEIV